MHAEDLIALLCARMQVFVFGGAIRRHFEGTMHPDIDIAFDCEAETVHDALRDHCNCKLSNKKQFITIYTDNCIVEGAHCKYSVHAQDHIMQEFTINSIFYHVNSKTWYNWHHARDIFNRTLRISATTQQQYYAWFHERHIAGMRFNKMYRYFWMIAQGYKPIGRLKRFMEVAIWQVFARLGTAKIAIHTWNSFARDHLQTREHAMEMQQAMCHYGFDKLCKLLFVGTRARTIDVFQQSHVTLANGKYKMQPQFMRLLRHVSTIQYP